MVDNDWDVEKKLAEIDHRLKLKEEANKSPTLKMSSFRLPKDAI